MGCVDLRHKLHRVVWQGSLAIFLVFACLTDVGAEGLSIAQIKAAYVYNFCQLTTFPEPTQLQPLTVWIAQEPTEELMAALMALQGRQVGSRRIEVVSGPRPSRLDVAYWDSENWQKSSCQHIHELNDTVLTIGCSNGFFECGGMIQLMQVDHAIRFRVNSATLEHSRVHLSSRLLKHAIH
ncbi:MAG: hypothetical protein C0620_04640 [Desulfuromonas sp.]|nr:MAG: hypothetical protein C0620_04640 [Desulfuromonas sp.]